MSRKVGRERATKWHTPFVPKNVKETGTDMTHQPYNIRKQGRLNSTARTKRFWTVHIPIWFFFWTHIPIWFVRTYVRPVHSGVISVTSGTNSQTWTARPLPYSVKDAHPSLHQASGKPILTNLQILITRAWTGTSPPRCQFYRASSQRYAKAHDAQGVIIAWSWSLQRRASGS